MLFQWTHFIDFNKELGGGAELLIVKIWFSELLELLDAIPMVSFPVVFVPSYFDGCYLLISAPDSEHVLVLVCYLSVIWLPISA